MNCDGTGALRFSMVFCYISEFAISILRVNNNEHLVLFVNEKPVPLSLQLCDVTSSAAWGVPYATRTSLPVGCVGDFVFRSIQCRSNCIGQPLWKWANIFDTLL